MYKQQNSSKQLSFTGINTQSFLTLPTTQLTMHANLVPISVSGGPTTVNLNPLLILQTFKCNQRKVKEENDGDPMGEHLHRFTVKFSPTESKKYNITCNRPRTVLEVLKSTKIYNKRMEMEMRADENIVIQLGKEDKKYTVATHFPCTCIRDGESLIISRKSKIVEAAKDQLYNPVQSRDKYSVFYIDREGGLNTKQKKLFRSKAVKQFKYLCVYGEKGMTVEEALKRDGRFIDDLGDFELSDNKNPSHTFENTEIVDTLDQKKLKLCLPRKSNEQLADQQANQYTSVDSQYSRQPDREPTSDVVQQSRNTVSNAVQERARGAKTVVQQSDSNAGAVEQQGGSSVSAAGQQGGSSVSAAGQQGGSSVSAAGQQGGGSVSAAGQQGGGSVSAAGQQGGGSVSAAGQQGGGSVSAAGQQGGGSVSAAGQQGGSSVSAAGQQGGGSVSAAGQQGGGSVSAAGQQGGGSLSAVGQQSVMVQRISDYVCSQFPSLREWMENQFPGDSYQQTLDLKREDFGKIQNSFSEVDTVRKLVELGGSVCLLKIDLLSVIVQGTGFVLFDNFILTNAHLFKKGFESKINDWQKYLKVTARFNYENQDSESNWISFNVKRDVVFRFDLELDYVVLELDLEAQNENVPPGLLKIFGPMPPNGGACLIGHPAGGVKKMDPTCIIEKEKREQAVSDHLHPYKDSLFIVHSISHLVKEQGIDSIMMGGSRAENIATYNTFMYHGSSGSPVFDAHGRVFGLHTAGFHLAPENTTDSVIEFAQPLLTIFEHFVSKLKESGNEGLLKRVEEEAKENPYLEKVFECSSVVKPEPEDPEDHSDFIESMDTNY
ncbi:hypothetical protein ABVT39_022453 [Epinephelus coioides]